MTAAPILNELRRHGVTVRREGDRLKLTAATVIAADLIELARAHKPELLAALADPIEQRRRLLRAALREGIDPEAINCLEDADLLGIEHWSDTQLRVAARWHRDDPPRLWNRGGQP